MHARRLVELVISVGIVNDRKITVFCLAAAAHKLKVSWVVAVHKFVHAIGVRVDHAFVHRAVIFDDDNSGTFTFEEYYQVNCEPVTS